MKKYIYIILGLLLFVGIVWLIKAPAKVSKYDDFAKCLKDKGVIFYGAFWCPHCQAQKARFGTASKYLPYIECSTPDGQSQNQTCKDKGIESYPTWYFINPATTTPDIVKGEIELADLAAKTSCVLPQ